MKPNNFRKKLKEQQQPSFIQELTFLHSAVLLVHFMAVQGKIIKTWVSIQYIARLATHNPMYVNSCILLLYVKFNSMEENHTREKKYIVHHAFR